jgi:hypothetical protein
MMTKKSNMKSVLFEHLDKEQQNKYMNLHYDMQHIKNFIIFCQIIVTYSQSRHNILSLDAAYIN